jgi:hypothetical protein
MANDCTETQLKQLENPIKNRTTSEIGHKNEIMTIEQKIKLKQKIGRNVKMITIHLKWIGSLKMRSERERAGHLWRTCLIVTFLICERQSHNRRDDN